MLTTIFFLFCVLHKRKHCPYANSRKRGRGTTLTTSRRHDRSGAAAAERGLVFYYKLTAFDRSWLIHWKLKKVSPSFFLFFLSPYIRLGMNQVVLFFLRANGRSWSTCYGFALLPYLLCFSYFALLNSKCLSFFICTTITEGNIFLIDDKQFKGQSTWTDNQGHEYYKIDNISLSKSDNNGKKRSLKDKERDVVVLIHCRCDKIEGERV